jgi:choline kinase
MPNTSVLILAAGTGMRFGKRPKQLYGLPRGETILSRMVRQIRSRGHEPILVTHNNKLKDAADSLGIQVFEPTKHGWTVETLLSTLERWNDRTIVFLGDVIYSMRVMNEVFACDDQIRVFGDEYEIFAVVFCRSVWEKVSRVLREVIAMRGKGTLRWFYQQYCGFPIGGSEVEDAVFHRICYIEDYTMDIDTPEDCEILRRKIERGRLEDE